MLANVNIINIYFVIKNIICYNLTGRAEKVASKEFCSIF